MCENLFTIKEVAALLNLSDETIVSLISSNRLEHFILRGRVRVSEIHLNNFRKGGN